MVGIGHHLQVIMRSGHACETSSEVSIANQMGKRVKSFGGSCVRCEVESISGRQNGMDDLTPPPSNGD